MKTDKPDDNREAKKTSDWGNGLRFNRIETYITRGAHSKLNPVDVMKSIARHCSGDWGDCCKEDWEENELALREGFRLFSVYHDSNGTKFWIITEADRSSTTILLPEEY